MPRGRKTTRSSIRLHSTNNSELCSVRLKNPSELHQVPDSSPSPSTPPKMKKSPQKAHNSKGCITNYFPPAANATPPKSAEKTSVQRRLFATNGGMTVTEEKVIASSEEDGCSVSGGEDSGSGKENEVWRRVRSEVAVTSCDSVDGVKNCSPLQPRRVITRSHTDDKLSDDQKDPSSLDSGESCSLSPPTPHKIKLIDHEKPPITCPSETSPQSSNLLKGSKLISLSSSSNTKEQTDHQKHNVITQRKKTKVTDFFPIRRSSRKPKTEIAAKQRNDIINHLLNVPPAMTGSNADANLGIAIKYYDNKGRGIEAKKGFLKGEFVVEYSGEITVGTAAAKAKETKYSTDAATGCYMYYFKHGDKHYCIDATAESGRLGRLINHSRLKPNLQTKVMVVNDIPRLILVAKHDIEPGSELLYDYGDRSKQSLKAHPWLAF